MVLKVWDLRRVLWRGCKQGLHHFLGIAEGALSRQGIGHQCLWARQEKYYLVNCPLGKKFKKEFNLDEKHPWKLCFIYTWNTSGPDKTLSEGHQSCPLSEWLCPATTTLICSCMVIFLLHPRFSFPLILEPGNSSIITLLAKADKI